MLAHRQTNRQGDRQIQTDRQTDRHRQTDTHSNSNEQKYLLSDERSMVLILLVSVTVLLVTLLLVSLQSALSSAFSQESAPMRLLPALTLLP